MRKRLRKKLDRRRVAARYQSLYAYVWNNLNDTDLRERRAKTLWVLFHSDFESYRRTGSPITGVGWCKGREHPWPCWLKGSHGLG